MSEKRGTKALEQWCRRMTDGYPGVKIDNMTTSWRDGLAFCAIIHHFRPDLIEFDKLCKTDIYYNNELAFTTAEKYLGIPALLDADDMAAYEVPDRLSILTYLSQFYQVFAHTQDSENGLKRAQPAGEKAQISKTTGPPSKMAHVVGVPRRDPCQKCQLPVFLAERLVIGKNVFHRTCLKCARCGSQLSPGSFYETELNNEYCCETCPDEEEQLDGKMSYEEADGILMSEKPLNTKAAARNSLSDRLAFFEQNARTAALPTSKISGNHKVLEKSVSDEEKRQHMGALVALSEQQEPKVTSEPRVLPTYKANETLSIFLQDTINDQDGQLKSTDNEDELPTDTQGTSAVISDTVENEQIKSNPAESLVVNASPPSLPQTEPPAVDSVVSNVTPPIVSARFTTKAELSLINNDELAQQVQTPLSPTATASEQGPSFMEQKTKTTESISAQPIDDTPEITERLHVVSAQLQVIKNEEDGAQDETKDTNILTEKNTDNDEQQLDVSKTPPITKSTLAVEEEYKDEEIVEKDNSEVPSVMKTKDNDLDLNILEDNQVNKTDIQMISETTIPISSTIKSQNEQLNEETTTLVDAKTETDGPSTPTIQPLQEGTVRTSTTLYPQSLNPFSSDEDEDQVEDGNCQQQQNDKQLSNILSKDDDQQNANFNPFDSSDDEVELEKANKNKSQTNKLGGGKVPPPRPPPPRIVQNPFGDCDESETVEKSNSGGGGTVSTLQDGQSSQRDMKFQRRSSLTSSLGTRTPMPTPRTSLTQSQTPTPEPTPRLSQRNIGIDGQVVKNATASKTSMTTSTPASIQRDNDACGSNNSLASSAGGTVRQRKSRRAPAPPPNALKELFPSKLDNNSSANTSMASTPSSSRIGSPKSNRKKRTAPAPPKPARLEAGNLLLQTPPNRKQDQENLNTTEKQIVSDSKNLHCYPQQSELDSKLSDEEKVLLEGKQNEIATNEMQYQRVIPLDDRLLLSDVDDYGDELTSNAAAACGDERSDDQKEQKKRLLLDALTVQEEESNVVYRRILVPPNLETPTHDKNPLLEQLYDNDNNEDETSTQHANNRQLQKLKDNKEAQNRNRQSQISISPSHFDASGDVSLNASGMYYNKSQHGKWKRRKGPAPALPIPPRKILQKLPLQEIRHELEIIEVQQQGLEKQGVILEKMIRDRCEGQTVTNEPTTSTSIDADQVDVASQSKDQKVVVVAEQVQNSKEVEDLILQLFELVNEKNELFRRQAELMYLRRQHRLEQEQADIEYEIRVLMGQPERNKTDTDKSREETLITRLVELVEQRNEVIDCLEMDRLREAEEDLSIKQRLELHNAKRGLSTQEKHKSSARLSKKEKKQQKEAKKLSKSKKMDAEKDADETELKVAKDKTKKKRKLFF